MTVNSRQSEGTTTHASQVRRAWLVLSISSVACLMIIGMVTYGAFWVFHHATEAQVASLTVVSGSGALIRSPGDPDWRLVSDDVTVREGDRISTALGTVVTLRLFDGSTVEITEDTVVRVRRMRASRFLNRTKLVVFEPERGAIYISVVPRGEVAISEVQVRVNELNVSMADEPDSSQTGSFLVEVLEDPSGIESHAPSVRVGVLRGVATLRYAGEATYLTSNEQVVVGPNGAVGAVTTVVRELIVNGDFSHGLSGWIEFEQTSQLYAGGATGTFVGLAQDETTLGDHVVVEFSRFGDDGQPVQAGIRQRIGKTLRVHTSLLLSFEALIVAQQPVGANGDLSEFPLVIQIEYVDIEDKEQTWSYGYYVIADDLLGRNIPPGAATRIDHNRWQRIYFDLRGLSPLPKQITSIVVYASGQSYQTRVANISLSTSELSVSEP